MACFFAGGTEAGIVSVLFILFPLYTRIKKERALDHFTRGRIYEHIKLKPGEHYSSIRNHLSLRNGTLAYHLKTLEMQGFIKSKRIGLLKRFYLIDHEIPAGSSPNLSKLQSEIINEIEASPGISQNILVERLGSTQQNLSYNLKVLERNGYIRSEESGRSMLYYIAPEETN